MHIEENAQLHGEVKQLPVEWILKPLPFNEFQLWQQSEYLTSVNTVHMDFDLFQKSHSFD